MTMWHGSPEQMAMHQLSRRQLLQRSACGFGSLAMASLLAEQAAAERRRENPLAPRQPMFAPRAKRVIFLFMQGGPSQVDTFDPKPELQKRGGEQVPFHDLRVQGNPDVGEGRVGPLIASPWGFKRYGQTGQPVSNLFPHIAKHVDDLCFIRSMHTEGVAHGPATLMLHTGSANLARPSVGSWVSYALGTENDNLPAFVTIRPTPQMGGPRNFGTAFLPPIYQGTPVGRVGVPATEASINHLTNANMSRAERDQQVQLLHRVNQQQVGAEHDENLESAIQSLELAHRMQSFAPDILDVEQESEATKDLYGIGEDATDDYGRQCLMARRMVEAGVRYVQVSYSDASNNPKWDQHHSLPEHEIHARATDKPVAGLLADLKQRGLLEDTLVWWGSEFGRNPYAEGQNGTGRDHNPNAFTMWLAGGGVKPGYSHGETDEFGFQAIRDRVHMHDWHATLLHLLGLDHREVTYRHAGRDFRLTDVYGRIVHNILA